MLANRRRFEVRMKREVKDKLRRYVSSQELLNGGKVTIPYIDIPRFKHQFQGGVSQGEGDLGDALNPGDATSHQGLIETGVTIEDVAKILAEEIGLPYQTPKEGNMLDAEKLSHSHISKKKGGRKNPRRSYLSALKRSIAEGSYNSQDPIVIPERDDWWYHNTRTQPDKSNKAVIIGIMDTSLSMGEQQRQLCRTEMKWTEILLKGRYPSIDIRYIIHSHTAEETDEHRFYHTYKAGGTVFSTAYQLCEEIIEHDYNEQWDVYPFQFSDGGNWPDDNDRALSWLHYGILPKSTMVCYGQCLSDMVTEGLSFLELIVDKFDLRDGIFVMPKLRLARINSARDHIPVLKTFLNEKSHPMYNVLD